MQKKAMRIICNKNYRDHTNELFAEKKILKLNDLFKVRISVLMYKARHMLLPPRIQLIFQFKNECDAYSLRKHSYFQLNQYRTTKKEMSLSIIGPNIWNKLPYEIRNAKNIKIFIRKYKYSLISAYSNI